MLPAIFCKHKTCQPDINCILQFYKFYNCNFRVIAMCRLDVINLIHRGDRPTDDNNAIPLSGVSKFVCPGIYVCMS